MKKIFALVIVLFSSMLAYAGEPDVYPCEGRSASGYIDCKGGIIGMERVVYTDINGVQRVETVVKSYPTRCYDDVCNSIQGNQYVGQGANGEYAVRNGYYLGYGADGRTYAYRNQTGPGFGGQPYDPGSNKQVSGGQACMDTYEAEFRRENGEDAMIIYDQINEWKEACGLPASE